MDLSKVFNIVSEELYSGDDNLIKRKINMLKNDYEIENEKPLCISGTCFCFNEDVDFMEEDIAISEDSFFIYDESGHSGEWRIVECKSLKDAENFILSGAGYFNMFCTDIIVFSAKEIFEFNVYYENGYEKIYLTKDNEIPSKFKLKIEWNSKII